MSLTLGKYIIQPAYNSIELSQMDRGIRNTPKGTKPRPKKSRRLKNALKVHNKFNLRKHNSKLIRMNLIETIRETTLKLFEESERNAKECQHG